MRTQSELQRAQERATSLQEDLALIRSTLLPLAQQQQTTPHKKSSLAAFTALQQHQLMQERQLEQQLQGGQAMASPGPKLVAAEDSLYLDDCSSPEGGYITAVHHGGSSASCKGRGAGGAVWSRAQCRYDNSESLSWARYGLLGQYALLITYGPLA